MPVTLLAFAALGLYGALRWGTMLSPDPVARLLGMLALAVAIAALGYTPIRSVAWLALPVGLLALCAVITLGGFPVSWVTHVRITVIARTIGQGLSGLPAVLVPYSGINVPVRAVMTMGAGVLLIDGALMLAFAPRSLGELRAAVAALPLVVLAVVPAALARPHAPYLQGAALFVLLAAVVWGERIAHARRAGAAAIVVLAAVAAVLVAPAIDTRHAWLDFRNFASALGAGRGERFNWTQSYRPLHWPRKGHQVLQIQARFPSYWKTENLETFDGIGWRDQAVEFGPFQVAPASLKRWTELLHVTDTGINSPQVIAAGDAGAAPTHLASAAIPGTSTGTWTTARPLRPGDSYLVEVYSPNPSRAELRAAGTAYPPAIASGYMSMDLPLSAPKLGAIPQPLVYFPPFHSRLPLIAGGSFAGPGARALIAASVYGPAYRLAQRLERRAGTPYGYARAVMGYLGHGYTYDEHTTASRYPIETFLFASRRGYCQQFAGAMALLLRMGGVPARVATGFTKGQFDRSTRSWTVSDTGAHAWVEAWFPRYGWVTFDPTPSVDPALSGRLPAASATALALVKVSARRAPRRELLASAASAASSGASGPRARRSGVNALELAAISVAVLAALSLLVRAAFRARVAAVDPVRELERAFARCGRPLSPGTTLGALEHRFRHTPAAARYVRTLALRRYAQADPDGARPNGGVTSAGRRAVRRELAPWRGPLGRLRALWALPPAPAPIRAGRLSCRRRVLESDVDGRRI
ncbi:MAG: transglutaminase-like domain-containing protein [Solirubrobacteraceae bacterium]